jgi:hypothetical protein
VFRVAVAAAGRPWDGGGRKLHGFLPLHVGRVQARANDESAICAPAGWNTGGGHQGDRTASLLFAPILSMDVQRMNPPVRLAPRSANVVPALATGIVACLVCSAIAAAAPVHGSESGAWVCPKGSETHQRSASDALSAGDGGEAQNVVTDLCVHEGGYAWNASVTLPDDRPGRCGEGRSGALVVGARFGVGEQQRGAALRYATGAWSSPDEVHSGGESDPLTVRVAEAGPGYGGASEEDRADHDGGREDGSKTGRPGRTFEDYSDVDLLRLVEQVWAQAVNRGRRRGNSSRTEETTAQPTIFGLEKYRVRDELDSVYEDVVLHTPAALDGYFEPHQDAHH